MGRSHQDTGTIGIWKFFHGIAPGKILEHLHGPPTLQDLGSKGLGQHQKRQENSQTKRFEGQSNISQGKSSSQIQKNGNVKNTHGNTTSQQRSRGNVPHQGHGRWRQDLLRGHFGGRNGPFQAVFVSTLLQIDHFLHGEGTAVKEDRFLQRWRQCQLRLCIVILFGVRHFRCVCTVFFLGFVSNLVTNLLLGTLTIEATDTSQLIRYLE